MDPNRRREWRLTFSPGEWLWVAGALVVLGSGWILILT